MIKEVKVEMKKLRSGFGVSEWETLKTSVGLVKFVRGQTDFDVAIKD